MGKKIAFSLEVEGADKLLSDLTKVETGLTQLSKELAAVKKDIDTFNNGTDEQKKALTDSGKSLESLEAKYKSIRAEQIKLTNEKNELNKAIRDEVRAQSLVEQSVPTDSLIGLRQQYKKLREEVDLMSVATKESAEGLEKIKKAADIKRQIDEMGDSVNDFRSRVGGYYQALEAFFSKNPLQGAPQVLGGIIDPIANILGHGPGGGILDILGGAASKLGPVGTVIGLVGTGTAALAGYVQQLTLEYERLNDEVGDLTGLTGRNLVSATVGVKTLTEVFDQDFNEVLRAANSLTQEVTGDFDKSLALIEKGFLAGADASGEYLDSLREYSTQVREAGISGEEFLEILIRSTREGIYSDKGIDAVKEFGLRIREQTVATKDALNDAFGKQFTDTLFTGINKGSVTTMDALRTVSRELSKGQITAKQTQTILADVFGGPGEDAGLRFIKILGQVDGNLDGLISKTDAYTIRQLDQLNATRELNQAQQDLASQFAGMGTSLDSLGTQIQAFGLRALDNLTSYFRGIGEIYSKDGIIGVITASEKDLDAEREKLRQKDYDALRQITSKELEENEKRRQSAIEGTLTIQELTAEQGKLKHEIDAARASGKDYTDLLDKYNTVTKNVAESTKIFSNNVNKSRAVFKDIAADGSIEALNKKVSDLQSRINKSTPNKALDLIDDLNKAELNLNTVKKNIDEYKKAFNDANPTSKEEVVRIATDRINLQRELDIQYLNESITNEQQKNIQIQMLNAESDKKILQQRLTLVKEGSAEAVKIQNEINTKDQNIQKSTFELTLANVDETINQTTALATTIAEKLSQSEKELTERKNAIRLNGEIYYIQTQLSNTKLGNDEKLKLEQDLADKKKQLNITNNSLELEYTKREAEINKELNLELTDAANQANLFKLEDYEKLKTEITLNAEIERLELLKELKVKNGEDTAELDTQIAEKKLEYDKAVNAKLIESNKQTLETQKKQQEEQAQAIGSLIEGTGALMGDLFSGTIKDAEDAQKAFIRLMIDTVEKLILTQVAAATAQSFAQPDSVATFGASGAVRSLILGALIKGAFSVLKGIIAEDGAIIGDKYEYGGLTVGGHLDWINGGVAQGRPHSKNGIKFLFRNQLSEAQGEEAVIKKESTIKHRGLLSAINEDTGGKQFSPDSWKYKPMLYMEQGGLTSNKIPQFVNKTSSQAAITIDSRDMVLMASIIATEQNKVISMAVGSIIEQVVAGLDTSNRLKDRQEQALINSQI